MRGAPVTFRDFSGGLNTKSAPYNLADNEARDCLNVQSTARGAVRKRDGSTAFVAPGAGVTGLFAVEATASRQLLVTSGTSAWKVDTAGVATPLAALPSAGRWEWVQAPTSGLSGPVYGSDGAGLRFYNGTALGVWSATSGTLRACKYLAFANNRVFMANDPANGPSRVYFSAIGDPCSWPSANVFDLDPSDGGQITGMATVGPYLVIAKERKLFQVYDLDTGANRRVSDNLGCIAHRSMVETPMGLFFLTLDAGVYVMNGSTVDRVSDNVTPTIETVQASLRSEAAGAYFGDRYFLSFSTAGSANNRTLEYDVVNKAWFLHDLAGQQWAKWRRVDGQELYCGKGAGAVVRAFVPGVSADSGAAFDSYWKGPFWVFGHPEQRKRVRQIRFDGSGTVSVSVAKDFTLGETLLGSTDFTAGIETLGGAGTLGGLGTEGGPAAVQPARVVTPGVARAWSLKVGNTTTAAWEVDSITMLITPRKD
jgi:hypothetical protein